MSKARSAFQLATIGALCAAAFFSGASASFLLKADTGTPAGPISYPAYQFSRNLRVGDSGSDVRILQIFLNKDDDTVIAQTGPGSRGSESEYFGEMTKGAVMRFQQKYRAEVLTPAGLETPTGYVGEVTRKKLNGLMASAGTTANISVEPSVSIPEAPEQTFFDLLSKGKTALYGVMPYEAKKGQKVRLIGRGFSDKNTVHIGSYTVNDVVAIDGSNLDVTLPSSLSNGQHKVWVENGNGSSKDVNKNIRVMISANPQNPPSISGVFPENVSLNGTVTVKGSFSSSGNMLTSALGTIENLRSSDGQITFSPNQLSGIREMIAEEDLPAGSIVTVNFYISNDHGASGTYGTINVTL